MSIANPIKVVSSQSKQKDRSPVYCLENGVHHEVYLQMSEDEFCEVGDDIFTPKKCFAEEFAKQGGTVILCEENKDTPFLLH